MSESEVRVDDWVDDLMVDMATLAAKANDDRHYDIGLRWQELLIILERHTGEILSLLPHDTMITPSLLWRREEPEEPQIADVDAVADMVDAFNADAARLAQRIAGWEKGKDEEKDSDRPSFGVESRSSSDAEV